LRKYLTVTNYLPDVLVAPCVGHSGITNRGSSQRTVAECWGNREIYQQMTVLRKSSGDNREFRAVSEDFVQIVETRDEHPSG
jgi:hypothetical protein